MEEEKTIEIRLKYVYDNYKKEIENIKKYLNINLLQYKSTGAFLNIRLNNYIKTLMKIIILNLLVIIMNING